MATEARPAASPAILNIPNQLTIARLALAVVLFALMAWELYYPAFYVFLVAAGTDWLDGFLARRYGWVTTLGRILDPFADKVIICGTFIFLAAAKNPVVYEAGLRAWVVTLVVGRELLITALRSFLEQQGADFSASMSGKLKMVAQCTAASFALFGLSYEAGQTPAWVVQGLVVSVWATIILTIWSGVGYIFAAMRLMRAS